MHERRYNLGCFHFHLESEYDELLSLIDHYLDVPEVPDTSAAKFSLHYVLHQWKQEVSTEIVAQATLDHAALDFKNSTVHSWLYTSRDASLETYKHNVLFTRPLAAFMHFHGFYPFHAALISKDDMYVLLLGEGGSGKSTLAAACSLQGYDFHCDDTVFVSPASHTLSIVPLTTRFKMKQAERKPELRKGVQTRQIPAVHQLPYKHLRMLLPQYREGSVALSPRLSEHELLQRLLAGNFVQENGQEDTIGGRRAQFQGITMLAQHVPAYKLWYHDHDLIEAGSVVNALLDC